MKQAQLTLIESNDEKYPPGSSVTGFSMNDALVELAGRTVEDVTYYAARQHVHIYTNLGYQFTVSAADYHKLVAE